MGEDGMYEINLYRCVLRVTIAPIVQRHTFYRWSTLMYTFGFFLG